MRFLHTKIRFDRGNGQMNNNQLVNWTENHEEKGVKGLTRISGS